METISINVESEVAAAYKSFKPQHQQQFEVLMSVILKRFLEEESLEDIVNNLRNESEG